MDNILGRILLGGLLMSFLIVRMVNHRKAMTEGGKIEYKEPNAGLLTVLRKLGGIVLVGGFVAYFINPEWLAWASIPFPDWLRWAGFGLGVVSVLAVWWTEFSLGLNFNATLHQREGHTLVTHGPYQWVRHPMYTSLYMMVIAWLLVSANWVIGLPGLIGLTAIVINRVRAEEQLMIELFGDQYRVYMQRTGRFLPKLGRFLRLKGA